VNLRYQAGVKSLPKGAMRWIETSGIKNLVIELKVIKTKGIDIWAVMF
jgi:hypothetical protein